MEMWAVKPSRKWHRYAGNDDCTRYTETTNIERAYLMIRVWVTTGCLGLVLLSGCGQGPNRAALVERIKSLESRITKLSDEIRSITTGRDQLREDLAKAEELIQKLQVVVKERDELKIQLKSRLAERDQVVGQYEQFRKNVRDMVGLADAEALRFPNGDP